MTTLSGTSSKEDIKNFLELEDEQETDLSLADIYNQLQVHGELILTIPAVEEEKLRTGLAGVKSKMNYKLKGAGLQTDKSTLSYIVTPKKDDEGNLVEGIVDIQILLKKRTQITVLAIKKPDMEI